MITGDAPIQPWFHAGTASEAIKCSNSVFPGSSSLVNQKNLSKRLKYHLRCVECSMLCGWIVNHLCARYVNLAHATSESTLDAWHLI